MARKKRKKNLNKQLKKHRKNLEKQNDLGSRLGDVSVVDDEKAPEEADLLAAEVTETVTESSEAVATTTAAADENLEGKTEVQWQAEGDVEAETNAAVADGATKPSPPETVGEEESAPAETPEVAQAVEKSVIPDEASTESELLKPEISETKREENEALESSTAAADENLEGETEVQWQAEGDVEAETDAAVADGATEPSPPETVGEEDDLESLIASPEAVLSLLKDIPSEGEKASVVLEGTHSTQWQDQSDVEAETAASVTEGVTEPSPAETAGEEENAEISSAQESFDADRTVSESVVPDEKVPEEDDLLAPEIKETKKEETEGLESSSAAADENLEGETEVQWQAEGDVEAETNAAVADGATEPSPPETVGEEKNAPTEETPEVAQTVATSVIPSKSAPEEDLLATDIPETKTEEKEGLESTSAAADANLEGETEVQWQAEYDVEAETTAAVMDGATEPSPPKTVGEEESAKAEESESVPVEETPEVAETVAKSVIPSESAPEEDLLAADIPETKTEEKEGLESTSAAADANLEGETEVQWQAEYDVEAETTAAVMDGATEPSPPETVGEEESAKAESQSAPVEETPEVAQTVAESVIPSESAPEEDLLAADIPETKTEEKEGLESTSAAAAANLEGETEVQWQAEGDVEAETTAAVADGATEPSPEETVGEEETDIRKRKPHNHPIEKELPIYLL